MGRIKENPRYNVLSLRVSDDTRQCIEHALDNRTMQDFLHAALEEKLIRDRQARIDSVVRGNR